MKYMCSITLSTSSGVKGKRKARRRATRTKRMNRLWSYPLMTDVLNVLAASPCLILPSTVTQVCERTSSQHQYESMITSQPGAIEDDNVRVL